MATKQFPRIKEVRAYTKADNGDQGKRKKAVSLLLGATYSY